MPQGRLGNVEDHVDVWSLAQSLQFYFLACPYRYLSGWALDPDLLFTPSAMSHAFLEGKVVYL